MYFWYPFSLILFLQFLGGAGLIQLPALILLGIPYSKALAGHKLATVALGLGGSFRNYKSLLNDIYIALQILIYGLPGVILELP